MVALRKLTKQAETGLAAIGQSGRRMADIQGKSTDTGTEIGGFGTADGWQQDQGRNKNKSQHRQRAGKKAGQGYPPQGEMARAGWARNSMCGGFNRLWQLGYTARQSELGEIDEKTRYSHDGIALVAARLPSCN